ncbi:MAG: L-2-hydroxyglutarate oxidase [Thermoplasmata archaeon]
MLGAVTLWAPVVDRYDLVIIGGGIVGLAAARSLRRRRPSAEIAVVEMESDLGVHQTGHNSGVIHSGIFYAEGSLKAGLTLEGRRQLLEFCRTEGIPTLPVGKLIVASRTSEEPALVDLLERARVNGVPGVSRLDREGLNDTAPGVAGTGAVLVPTTAIVEYPAVVDRLARRLEKDSVALLRAHEVTGARREEGGWRLETSAGLVGAQFVVNCAGLRADLVARCLGVEPSVSIVPFRGDFFELEGTPRERVRMLVYPVPDPRVPFVGVHLTPTVSGQLLAGPNAAIALAREGYRPGAFDASELARLAEFPGVWSLLRRYPGMAAREWLRSWSPTEFLSAIRRLWPEAGPENLGARRSGIRAQAMRRDGSLVEDFVLTHGPAALHVLNAPSPAATASFAIGDRIAEECLAGGVAAS